MSEDSMFAWLGIAFSFMVVAYFTFEPFHSVSLLPRYPPLFHTDRDSSRRGRWFVVAPAATCFYRLMVTPRPVGEQAELLMLISGYLVIPAFFAVHWAFQPENVFPGWVLITIYNFPFRPWIRRLIASRDAIPLQKWLAGLLACCESVVAGTRLDNSDRPGPGEIDCLELQHKVLDELKSRACLTYHKKLLSQDGFREIRRFLQAVDNLDHKSTNELTWPAVVQSARTVLDLQARLTADA
jgi:hypothetical protein